MDHLATMRAFVETVKKGSLTNAAPGLGTSRALVSRQIQALEDRLGVRLMHRSTRSISLTTAGEKYFLFCEAILSQISAMEQEIADEEGVAEGGLAILAPKWLGGSIGAEAVAAFAAKYPSITPKLSLGGMSSSASTFTAYNFLEQGFDVAFHTHPMPDSRIKARRVATIRFVLCAAPSYLTDAPALAAPADVAAHKGLVQFNYPGWNFGTGSAKAKATPIRAMESNSYLALHRGALAGLGVSVLPKSLVAADLDAGRLVALLPEHEIETQALFIAMAPGDATPAKVRLFVEFISDWFRAHPA